jgi:hypothetical protein
MPSFFCHWKYEIKSEVDIMALAIPKVQIPDYITDNLGYIGIGTGAALIGAAAGVAGTKIIGGGSPSSSSKKKTKKKKASKKKKLTPLQKRRRKIIARPGRQTPYTARGGKDRSTRRIRMTKHGQPYVILKSGKAKFIKKSYARASRKRKGGRY